MGKWVSLRPNSSSPLIGPYHCSLSIIRGGRGGGAGADPEGIVWGAHTGRGGHSDFRSISSIC